MRGYRVNIWPWIWPCVLHLSRSEMAAGTLFQELGCYGSDVVDLSISSQDFVFLHGCKDGMELGTMHCLVDLILIC